MAFTAAIVLSVTLLLSAIVPNNAAFTHTSPSTDVTIEVSESSIADLPVPVMTLSGTTDANFLAFGIIGADANYVRFVSSGTSADHEDHFSIYYTTNSATEAIELVEAPRPSLQFQVYFLDNTGDFRTYVGTVTVLITPPEINDQPLANLTLTDSRNISTSWVSLPEQTFLSDELIFRVRVEDADWSDLVSPVRISVHPDSGGKFRSSGSCNATDTSPVHECGVWVAAGTELDYEDTQLYTLEVIVSDSISQLKEEVRIFILNVVDERPSFRRDNLPASIRLAETPVTAAAAANSESVIYRVTSVNNEHPFLQAHLAYSLDPATALDPNGTQLFEINGTSGEISRTSAPISFEDLDPNDPFYHLSVTVRLTTAPHLNRTENLTVEILDSCEAPVFLFPNQGLFIFRENSARVGDDFWDDIAEDEKSGFRYNLSVIDPDSPSSGFNSTPGHVETLTYSISPGPNSWLFSLNCSNNGGQDSSFELSTMTGVSSADCSLFWTQVPDFETLDQKPEFDLVITASDSCGSKSSTVLRIAVANVNDNRPIFINQPYDKTIPENSARGHYITTVTASDPDSDPDMDLEYSLNSRNPGDFPVDDGNYWFYLRERTVVNSHTAMVADLYLWYPWDRDLYGDTAAVTVYAADNAPGTTPPYSLAGTSTSSVTFSVTFEDRNDNRPLIPGFFNREVPYNAPSGANLGVILSSNVSSSPLDDAGLNNEFRYRLMAPSLNFEIDAVSGSVTKSSYSQNPELRYDIFVVSSDIGDDPETRLSPLSVIRIDSYNPEFYHIKVTMGISVTHFETRIQTFLKALSSIFDGESWIFRLYETYESSGSTVAIIYALTSDVTEFQENLNQTKTFVPIGQLLNAMRLDGSGTPVDILQSDSRISHFSIQLVQPEKSSSSSRNFWTRTEEGVITITSICTFCLFVSGLIGALVYYALTRRKPTVQNPVEQPAPPRPPPKAEPLKQTYEKSGPGPSLIVAEEDDEVIEVTHRDKKHRPPTDFDFADVD